MKRLGTSFNLKSLLDSLAALSIIVVCSVVTWTLLRGSVAGSEPTGAASPARKLVPPAEPVLIDQVTRIGSSAAKVGVIEFADFECPFCRKFADGPLAEMKQQYIDKGRVLFGYHHLPLRMHKNAVPAAVAAECAGQYGKFWEFHDSLYDERERLDPAVFEMAARRLNLDAPSFARCLESGEHKEKVSQATTTATRLGVFSTPTLFMGLIEPDGRLRVTDVLVGAQPFAAVRTILDRLLANADRETR